MNVSAHLCRWMLRPELTLAAVLLAATSLAGAEQPAGRVTGRVVYGPDRKPVPNAIVYLGARAATSSNLSPVTVEVRDGDR